MSTFVLIHTLQRPNTWWCFHTIYIQYSFSVRLQYLYWSTNTIMGYICFDSFYLHLIFTSVPTFPPITYVLWQKSFISWYVQWYLVLFFPISNSQLCKIVMHIDLKWNNGYMNLHDCLEWGYTAKTLKFRHPWWHKCAHDYMSLRIQNKMPLFYNHMIIWHVCSAANTFTVSAVVFGCKRLNISATLILKKCQTSNISQNKTSVIVFSFWPAALTLGRNIIKGMNMSNTGYICWEMIQISKHWYVFCISTFLRVALFWHSARQFHHISIFDGEHFICVLLTTPFLKVCIKFTWQLGVNIAGAERRGKQELKWN